MFLSKTNQQRNVRTGKSGIAHLVSRALIGLLFLAGATLFADGLWIKAKAQLAQVLIASAFAKPVGEPARPWPWADMEPVARIEAHGLGEVSYALTGVSGEALAFGPGHMINTPMPGTRGTAVFAGHRDTHFAWIGQLKPGDPITITMRDGGRHVYTVQRAWVARYDQSGIAPDSDRHLIALTTCWPLGAMERGPQRYIVEAELQVASEQSDPA